MRRNLWTNGLVLATAAVLTFSRAPASRADDADRAVQARLERMEQRIQQLAQRQERMLEHLGGGPEQPGWPRTVPGTVVQPAPAGPACPLPLPPQPGQHPLRHPCRGFWCVIGVVLLVIHILLASWVFTDIRKRGEGSGLFIVLVLLAGIPGTIVYALVRIGDRVGEKRA